MAVTLVEHAMQGTDMFSKGFLKAFEEQSDLARVMPQVKIRGEIKKYRIEQTASTTMWRRVNEGVTESTGVLHSAQEALHILSGKFFIDQYLEKIQRDGEDALDHKVTQSDMKARALAREYERAVFEGDDLVDPDEMMGLRRRLTGTQVALAGAGGATLTLAMIDTMIDNIVDGPGKVHLFMNRALRRKLTNLCLAVGGSMQIEYAGINDLDRRIKVYDGCPIHIVEDGYSASTILGFDEDPGDGTADTASIYGVRFGEGYFHGIYNGPDGKIVTTTKSTGSDPPGEYTTMEMYVGTVLYHPRSAYRLRGVTNT